MFLDSDQLWFLSNLPTLQQFSKIYAQLLSRPPPLLEHFATTRDMTLPTTIAAWKLAQDDDPAFLADIPPLYSLVMVCLSTKIPTFPHASWYPQLYVKPSSANTTPTSNTFPTPRFLPRSHGTTTGSPSRRTSARSSKIVNSAKMSARKEG